MAELADAPDLGCGAPRDVLGWPGAPDPSKPTRVRNSGAASCVQSRLKAILQLTAELTLRVGGDKAAVVKQGL